MLNEFLVMRVKFKSVMLWICYCEGDETMRECFAYICVCVFGLFIYLGYGEPLMGFCPYFRHAHKSDDRLSAVTWHTIFFCWLFL
ncbi:hypothetical protein JHK87_045521 [Glycine soja]|nr:hypothetical protein JHK87_045521 [Glycine soja]